MANYANLKAAIDTVIKANGQQEITGTVLNQTLTAMVNSLGAGYLFMGVAIPSTNPGTPDQNVFYLARQAGTYSNFGAIALQAGLSILKYNGTWSSETLFTFDASITQNSGNPITSGAVFEKMKLDGGAYDVSAHNNNQTFASLSALLSDANLSTLIPTNIRSGGMSIKFIQTSDNKYVQYRLMNNQWSILPKDWQIVYNDYFYYVYGTGTTFTSTSIHIVTLGILKKNGSTWSNLSINRTFTVNGNDNLVLQSDNTVVIKNSQEIISSDVVLLTHSNIDNDWIGGVLFCQYIKETLLPALQNNIDSIKPNLYTFSLTNVEYLEHSVKITNGKLWWVNKYTQAWGSTSEITNTYTFSSGVTSFFVLDTTNNTLVVRGSAGNLQETDIILLQHTSLGIINAGILYPDYLKSKINDVANEINDIEDEISGNLINSIEYVNGSVINSTGVYKSGAGSLAIIHVNVGETVTIKSQVGKPFVYSLLASDTFINNEVIDYAPGWDHNIVTEIDTTIELEITEGANYLLLLNTASDNVNYLPKEISTNKIAQYGKIIHLSEKYKKLFRETISAAADTGVSNVEINDVVLRQGGYNDNLVFISDDKYRVSTNPIRDGKLFETYDDYRIEKAILLDRDLNVINAVNNIYLTRELSYAFPAYTDRKSWGTDNLIDGYYIVVSFVRADGSKIEPTDGIIKNIYDVHSDNLTPLLTEVPQLENALKRSNQIQNLIYKTQAPLPVITDYNTSTYKEVPANTTCIGMMYCSSKEYDKYVPTHVSYKTFMSAIHNKRSLIYTEIIGGSNTRSSYGISYHGGGCVTYYGINCNYNVFNVLGIIIPQNTGEVHNIDGMQLIYDSASENEFDIQELKPLDIIVRGGHICIISNVYKNKFGKNTVIAFSEANVTYARTSLYTTETFLTRLHQGDYDHPETNVYKIYRYSYPNNNAWENVYRRSEYIKASYEEYANDSNYNDDICTFAGDDAKFIEGEKIFLNINRGNYTQCQIYKDDILLNTINLSNDEEIDLDLTSYNLTDGSYKARLTDGTVNSDYTHWEVYNLSLSINSLKVASFSSTRLTPLYFEFQNIGGVFYGRALISDQERESGEKTLTEDFSSSRYLKLFARTPDGYLITTRIVYNI